MSSYLVEKRFAGVHSSRDDNGGLHAKVGFGCSDWDCARADGTDDGTPSWSTHNRVRDGGIQLVGQPVEICSR